MLILTRRIGETIYINHDIQITVLTCSKGSTRIGINAPSEFAIYREEIYQRIQAEKLDAHIRNTAGE